MNSLQLIKTSMQLLHVSFKCRGQSLPFTNQQNGDLFSHSILWHELYKSVKMLLLPIELLAVGTPFNTLSSRGNYKKKILLASAISVHSFPMGVLMPYSFICDDWVQVFLFFFLPNFSNWMVPFFHRQNVWFLFFFTFTWFISILL